MLQKHDDACWLLSGSAVNTVAWVAQTGLAFDALVDVRHLVVMAQLAARHPDLPIVIDHMAKPWRQPERMVEWSRRHAAGCTPRKLLREDFRLPLLGLWRGRGLCRALPFAAGLVRRRAPDLGSDWPVLTRHIPYEQCVARACARFSDADWQRVGHANAERVYGLKKAGAPILVEEQSS